MQHSLYIYVEKIAMVWYFSNKTEVKRQYTLKIEGRRVSSRHAFAISSLPPPHIPHTLTMTIWDLTFLQSFIRSIETLVVNGSRIVFVNPVLWPNTNEPHALSSRIVLSQDAVWSETDLGRSIARPPQPFWVAKICKPEASDCIWSIGRPDFPRVAKFCYDRGWKSREDECRGSETHLEFC